MWLPAPLPLTGRQKLFEPVDPGLGRSSPDQSRANSAAKMEKTMTTSGAVLNQGQVLATSNARSVFSRYAPVVARCLLGLPFCVAGLNGFLNFFPPPPPDAMPAGAQAFSDALLHTGYFMHLLAAAQTLGGALLVVNRFVPLALAVLAPIVLNILAFHLVLAPGGIVMAIVVVALETYLAWTYRAAFKPMLAARAATA
jgi:uncharacterized membrane protein YphA (DoxX/SURF4 family)